MSIQNSSVPPKLRPWLLAGATLIALAGLGLLLLGVATPLRAQSQATPTATLAAGAAEYRVQPGDSWILLAQRFGVPVRELQAANPDKVRWNRWLLIGERLIIPAPGTTAVVTTTATITDALALTTTTAVAATTAPTSTTTPTEAPTETETPTPAPTETPTEAPTEAPTETETPTTTATDTPAATATTNATTAVTTAVTTTEAMTATQAITASTTSTTPQSYIVQPGEGWGVIAVKFGLTMRELMAANPRAVRAGYVLYRGERLLIPAPGATPTAAPTEPPTPAATASAATTPVADAATPLPVAGCPLAFSEYPEVLLTQINDPTVGVAGLPDFLARCNAQVAEGVSAGDWTSDGNEDAVVVYANPISATSTGQMDLIIFMGGADGYRESYRAKAAGVVTLLATEDLNADDQPDVAWVDRTCGASTCFDTVEVVSWDGRAWRDWTQEAITMAYAGIEVGEAATEGQGQEIMLSGGVYGSVGAGPQRSRVEIWGSVAGAPYSLLSKVNSPSNCLYHTVLDANDALLSATTVGFAQAETLYSKAATDQKLEACWTRDSELTELRSFSLFRLAVTAAYEGQAGVAADVIASLSSTYPDAIYDQVGQTWLAAYQATSDIGAACGAANQFATANPAAYEMLADYGYANPTFDAGDVCPVLDVEIQNDDATSATQPLTATAVLTGAAPLTATGATTQPTLLAANGAALPACPADLGGYTTALAELLTAAGSDEELIERWLRGCAAMSDERGGFTFVDANRDGVEDIVFWPTVVSDLGFGPDGAQGDVLIFHGAATGAFTLAADQEIYGQPTMLATEDLNGDGALDLAWQVIGCSTFCVLEAQVVSWDGSAYASIIQPGATIAEGAAAFEPISAGDPGQGQQLVLVGGVSGTAEGGLAVPHTEIWQSVAGAAFQRIRWTYDRTVEGNDCMGLRLVEADAALHAGALLGYQPAVDLYSASIDPGLKACSIFGLQVEEELVLLQGLASFRLIQATALAGDLAAARTYQAAFANGQPDSDYAKAAAQWLDRYEQTQNAASACQAVQKIFLDNTALWQITDHFGYNHPALAAEQICYTPES